MPSFWQNAVYTTNWLLYCSAIQGWPISLMLAMLKSSLFGPPFNMFYYLSQENSHSVDVLGNSKTQMLDFHVYLFSNRSNMEISA